MNRKNRDIKHAIYIKSKKANAIHYYRKHNLANTKTIIKSLIPFLNQIYIFKYTYLMDLQKV